MVESVVVANCSDGAGAIMSNVPLCRSDCPIRNQAMRLFLILGLFLAGVSAQPQDLRCVDELQKLPTGGSYLARPRLIRLLEEHSQMHPSVLRTFLNLPDMNSQLFWQVVRAGPIGPALISLSTSLDVYFGRGGGEEYLGFWYLARLKSDIGGSRYFTMNVAIDRQIQRVILLDVRPAGEKTIAAYRHVAANIEGGGDVALAASTRLLIPAIRGLKMLLIPPEVNVYHLERKGIALVEIQKSLRGPITILPFVNHGVVEADAAWIYSPAFNLAVKKKTVDGSPVWVLIFATRA